MNIIVNALTRVLYVFFTVKYSYLILKMYYSDLGLIKGVDYIRCSKYDNSVLVLYFDFRKRVRATIH